MINAILAGQAVVLNPVLRPPSALTAGASITTGSPANTITWLGTAADVSATQFTTSDADLVNVSGKGVCLFCAFFGTTTASCVGTITIDGVVVYSAGSTGIPSKLKAPIGCVTAIDTSGGRAVATFEAVPFYTSLRIQYRSDAGGTTVGAAAKYRLTN